MLLAKSYQYHGKKISVRVDKLTLRGTIYIDGKITNILNTTEINLLCTEAQAIVDKEVYGNIHNIRY